MTDFDAWRREIEREKAPQVKRFLQESYEQQLRELAERGRKQRREKPSKAAIRASIEWQKP